jgi:hypothetical protein
MTNLFANLPEERAAAIDQTIDELLRGVHGGPYGLTMSDEEKTVLRRIRYHRGAKNAITIREITASTKFDERTIKGIVRKLRLSFQLPIGSNKHGSTGGYFIIVTAEDLSCFLAGPLQQIQAELQVVHAVGGSQAARELLGQLQLEVKE